MARTLRRMGIAWCAAVLVLLTITLLVLLLRDGWASVGESRDGLGVFAVIVLLAPGLLSIMLGNMLLARQRNRGEIERP